MTSIEICGEWSAWHDRMPGTTPTIHATGAVRFRETGWNAELQQRPFGINPKMLRLELVVTEVSETHADQPIEQEIHWQQDTDAELDQVEVFGEGFEGFVLDVVQTS